MDKKRRYVQFFREWWDSMKDIESIPEKWLLMEMVMNLAFDGKEPTNKELSQLGAMGKMYWNLSAGLVRNSRKNFENGCNGGAPKGNRNAVKFKTPTENEVRGYFNAKGYASNYEAFFSYNEAMGWEMCKKRFKNWKTAADQWEKKGEEFGEWEYKY